MHSNAFGLVMAGIISKAAGKLENKFKYNDATELNTDLGLDWYETKHRGYDPQLGRFHQIDILTDFFHEESAYTYCGNNPISFNDPLGLSKRGKGFPDDKEADDDLPEVVVKPKKKQTGADFGFGWANFDKKAARKELDARYTYFQQRNAGQPAGDNSTYENIYQIEQENRAMQMWVAGILSAPFVAMAAVESGALYSSGQFVSYSGRALVRFSQWAFTSPTQIGASNLISGAADASFQLVANNGDFSQVNWASVGFNTLAKGGLVKSSIVAGLGSSSATLKIDFSNFSLSGRLDNPLSLKGAFNVTGNLMGGFLGKSFGADLPLGRTIGGSSFYNFVGNFSGNVVGNTPDVISKTIK